MGRILGLDRDTLAALFIEQIGIAEKGRVMRADVQIGRAGNAEHVEHGAYDHVFAALRVGLAVIDAGLAAHQVGGALEQHAAAAGVKQ